MEADLPLRSDEEISGARINVKHTEHEDLAQIRAHEVLREAGAVRSDLRILDPPPATPLLDDNGLAH